VIDWLGCLASSLPIRQTIFLGPSIQNFLLSLNMQLNFSEEVLKVAAHHALVAELIFIFVFALEQLLQPLVSFLFLTDDARLPVKLFLFYLRKPANRFQLFFLLNLYNVILHFPIRQLRSSFRRSLWSGRDVNGF